MKLTIRKKLLGGFLLVIALLMSISYFSITKMNEMGTKTEEIDTNWVPSLSLVGDLNGAISDIQRLLLKFILETDQQEMNTIEIRIEETLTEIDQILNEYQPYISSAQEQKAYDVLKSNYKDYVNSFPAIMQKAKINAFEEANRLQLESHSKWQEANQSIQTLIEINQNGANSATEESVQIFNTGVSFVTTLSVIALIVGIGIALIISRMISNPLILMNKSAQQIAEGDLTIEEITVKNNDEIGELASSFNKMTINLRALINEVRTTSEQVAASSEELTASAEQTSNATEMVASTMQQVATGVDQQVKSVDETSKTIGELSIGIQQVATNAEEVTHTALEASEGAKQGGQVIENVIQQMNSINDNVNGLEKIIRGLGDSSVEIGKIIEVITSISDQTNLLALNAAIEAARAGEHGKGFAVVADEVRKLAEQSSDSAKQISQLVLKIQSETKTAVQTMESTSKEVNEGIEIVDTAGKAFSQIEGSIVDVNVQIQEVSSAVQQMAAGAEQMVGSMESITKIAEESASGTQEVSAATEEQLASMEEIASSAQTLSKMAEELQLLVSKFKIS